MLLSLLLSLAAGPAFAESPWSPPPAPAGWEATLAEWKILVRDDGPIEVEGTYTLESPDLRSGQMRLVGTPLMVTNVDGPVYAAPDGLRVVFEGTEKKLVQRFSGLYMGSAGSLQLPIQRATRTRVVVEAPGLDVEIPGAIDGWIAPTETLSVTWRPHREGEVVRESLVMQGEAASVFRAEGGQLVVEGTVRWRVVRGEATRLRFDAAGLEELEVAGAGVKSWRREGREVVIEPKAPVKGLFAVTVKGRSPLGKGQRAVPLPEPSGVSRVDRYVTMARADEGELIPVSAPQSVPLGRLPVWARNLSDGVPLVAWHGPQGVQVLPGAWEAIQGPDTVVTQARYTVATAREGRIGLRMQLRVRNERRQYLHLRPGEGWRPIVVRVGNQPVSWLSDGAGGIYVPLEKSVETVKGLLAFPVDVEWIGEGQGWEKRGEMALTLPSVDAPVQAASWEVHLPRGYRALRKPDPGTGRFTLTDLRGGEEIEDQSLELEEERRKQEVVSSALQNAVIAYKNNDWSGSQRWLDEAKEVDASNEEVAGLQSNLDVIEGRSAGNDSGSRRVRELAKAKTSGSSSRQAVVEKEAEMLYRAGDLDAAEEKYAEALELASTLQKVEQQESVEQRSKMEAAEQRISSIRSTRSANRAATSASTRNDAWGAGGLGLLGTGEGGGGNAESAPDEGIAGGVVGGQLGAAYGGSAGGFGTGMGGNGAGASGYGSGGGDFGAKGEGGVAEALEDEMYFEGLDDNRMAPEPMEAPPEPEPTAASGVTLTKEFLEKIPAGRDYQSSVQSLPGVIGGRPKQVEKKKSAKMSEEADKDSYDGEDVETVVVESKSILAMGKKPAAGPPAPATSPKADAAPRMAAPAPVAAYSPPPPPPPPPMAKPKPAEPSKSTSASGRITAGLKAGKSEELVYDDPAPPADMPASEAMDALGYIDVPAQVDEADPAQFGWTGSEMSGEATTESTLRSDPATAERPRRVPERRRALEASPSPMALALPLDGPAITHADALLPAGDFPTFRFRYKELPSENL